MGIKYIPTELELKLPHYFEQDKWLGKKFKVKKHLITDTILRKNTTAVIRELIFAHDESLFAFKVQYEDGTMWNEDPHHFFSKIVSLIEVI